MDEPETKPTGRDHQQIAGRIKDAIAARGLSQADIARQSDMSPAVLSEYLSGRYRGDREEAGRKLTAWLDGIEAGCDFVSIIDRLSVYAETSVASRIMATLRLAKLGKIVSIAGSSGVGKTMALREFQRTETAVWYSQFSPDMKSVHSILTEIATAVGVVKVPSNPDMVRREIVARVERTRGVILCDEAQHLPKDGFEAVRTLHDRAGVGIVFAGHLDLNDKIAKLPQLVGRISGPLRIGGAKPADADALFKSWGLECKRSRDFLRRFANRSTGLRRIAAVFELAAMYALSEGCPVSYDHIFRAWTDLEGPAQPV